MERAEAVAAFLVYAFVYMVVDAMNEMKRKRSLLWLFLKPSHLAQSAPSKPQAPPRGFTSKYLP